MIASFIASSLITPAHALTVELPIKKRLELMLTSFIATTLIPTAYAVPFQPPPINKKAQPVLQETQVPANEEQSIELLSRAAAHIASVGIETAVMDFQTNPEWRFRDLNLMAFKPDGTSLADRKNPKAVGLNMLASTDVAGSKPIYRMISATKKSTGTASTYYTGISKKNVPEYRVLYSQLVKAADVIVVVSGLKP